MGVKMAVKKQFTSFEEVISESQQPVLVDFYATWCGPCHMMAKILEEINGYLKSRIKVVKVDTDKYPVISSQYGIAALPTLVLFKNGQPVDKIEGVLPPEQLIQRLQSYL
jgi:thioredoxin